MVTETSTVAREQQRTREEAEAETNEWLRRQIERQIKEPSLPSG
jgi:hypothetical protein